MLPQLIITLALLPVALSNALPATMGDTTKPGYCGVANTPPTSCSFVYGGNVSVTFSYRFPILIFVPSPDLPATLSKLD